MPEVSSNKNGIGISSKQNRPLPRVANRSVASIRVVANNNQVIGYIQSMGIQMQRAMNVVYPVGQMSILELSPGGMQGGGKLTVERMFLYEPESRLVNVFSTASKPNVLANNESFSVLIMGKEGTTIGSNAILNKFGGCWFSGNSYDIRVSDASLVIVEKADILFAWVDSGDMEGASGDTTISFADDSTKQLYPDDITSLQTSSPDILR